MFFRRILLIFLLLSTVGVYPYVYSDIEKNTEVTLIDILSKTVYTDDVKLNSTIVVFQSENDISSYTFSSTCDVKTQLLFTKKDYYFFSLTIPKGCKNSQFFLNNNRKVINNTSFKMELIDEFALYNMYTDYSSFELEKEKVKMEQEKENSLLGSENEIFNYIHLKKTRIIDEIDYKGKIIQHITQKRKEKYIIPIVGYDLPTKVSKLPNSLRPYRAGYTFGIHEGWDINAPLSTPVVSLDEGIVVRVINDFEWDDLTGIKKGKDITFDDKINNLDILRGNQVWLKTMKGDVIFYSHLEKVFSDVQEGMIIKKMTPLGTVGISGVPYKNYTDYHLHFEVKKNPYISSKAGKNTFMDYMKWDWYYKGEKSSYITENQYNIFQK